MQLQCFKSSGFRLSMDYYYQQFYYYSFIYLLLLYTIIKNNSSLSKEGTRSTMVYVNMGHHFGTVQPITMSELRLEQLHKLQESGELHPGKLRWQWRIHHFHLVFPDFLHEMWIKCGDFPARWTGYRAPQPTGTVTGPGPGDLRSAVEGPGTMRARSPPRHGTVGVVGPRFLVG